MSLPRKILIWAAVALCLVLPLTAAANSPLLAWRQPIYIVAGFAGVFAMALMFVQPLLAGGYIPGLPARHGRRIHRWIGGMLVISVLLHVAGLWITSPPDVIDALLFVSPTPFSVWGVIAMWALFLVAFFAALRRKLRINPRIWRIGHTILAIIIVLGTIIHALLIEGTMETTTKIGLSVLILAATAKVVIDLRVWALLPRRST